MSHTRATARTVGMTSFGAGFLQLEGDFYPGMRKDMRRLYDFGFERAKSTGWGTLPEEIEGSEDLETLCRGRIEH